MPDPPFNYLPSRRTVISTVLALAATTSLIYYEDALLHLPAVVHAKIRYIKIFNAGGSEHTPKPQATVPVPPAAAAVPAKTVAPSVQVNKPVEHAPVVTSATVKPTAPPALQKQRVVQDKGTGPNLDIVQPDLPAAPAPSVPIAAMPAPAPVGPADHSIQVDTMPAVAQAIDQMDQHLIGGPGLVVAALIDSDGHVVQVVREQSGGDDIQDAAVMETMKQRIIQMNPPVPAGQKRWGEFRFNYATAAQPNQAGSPSPAPVP